MTDRVNSFAPVFIVGCGDIGARVARRWLARGARVCALSRSGASAGRLKALGITPVAGDLDRAGSLQGLPTGGALVYYFAPPPATGQDDARMGAFLTGLRESRPERIVYLSTSGVYGDRGGEWVTEQTQPGPQTDRARRRLSAEQQVRGWGVEYAVPVVVLRVGGIYAPDRLPLERLEAGTPVLRESECGWTNRIHADDLARVCEAAAERGRFDSVYNVCDDEPGTMTQFFYAAADYLGLPRPPAISMEEARRQLSPAMLSYLTESRRMDNRRMHEELGVALDFPNLAQGLGPAAGSAP